MPDNVSVSVDQPNRNQHSTMATFDNPSYFTISGQSPVATATSPTDVVESIGAKPKRFKSWFKLPKRPFRSKIALNQPENAERMSENSPLSCASPEPETQSNPNDFAHSDVVYYNFCPTTQETVASADVNNDDDVFSDTSTIKGNGSTRTLSRRRHSLGSWFRSSLAAVRKHNMGSSTASGLESHGTAIEPAERPSTSSERALLARNVSTSANCVSSASARDVRTPERGRSTETKPGKRSRLPVVVKSHVELRARARYARQEKLVRDNKAVSTSRIPRAVQSPHQRHQTTSLDRRYTKSTEVLASKPEDVTSPTPQKPTAPTATATEQLEEEDSFQQREDSSSSRRKSLSSATSRQRFVQRSRTIEDRHRTSCCGRMAAAAASTSSRGERRRASFDAASPSTHSRRRCQRCRDKAEPIGAEKVDVVIIFSKNCIVAYQWITYLTEILSKIFSSSDRPPTRVTSRDVESLVDSKSISPRGQRPRPPNQPSAKLQKNEYQNVMAEEHSDAERNVRQHALRKTVATASLQIVLLSKALLNHVGLHANDPLGTILHHKRVLGLFLGVNESKDIMPLHRSALCSFDFWPKITMMDQDMKSVAEFGKRAQEILGRSQPVVLVEANLQPARFKITPKKLRSGEERVTLILLETTENIQVLASIYVGIDSKKSVRIEQFSWVNPYVVNFNMPRTFLERGIIVKVQLKVGNASWGVRDLKCQSKLGEIAVLLSKNQLMGSPTDIMCQALNISPVDNEELDIVLTNSLDKAKVALSSFCLNQPDNGKREEEYPTLLHFAARYDLKNLMWELLECVGSIQALYVRNRDGCTALQLAEMNGHEAIVNCLNSFLEAVEADKADSDKKVGNWDYVPMDHSRKVDDTEIGDYDNLPKPKPVRHFAPDHADEVSLEHSNDLHNEYIVVLPNASMQRIHEGPEIERSAVEERANVETSGKLSSLKQIKSKEEKRQILPLEDSSASDTLQDEEASCSAVKPTNCQPSAFTSELTATVVASRGSSPLSNWSSSDRSSVTSHLSHDSGTHFESSEEKKVLANIHSDYDVLPSTTILMPHFVMPNYVVPPPPRSVNGKNLEIRENEAYVPSHHQLIRSSSPRLTPRPPAEFRNPFETIELNPRASQAVLGEDLGLIIPNEEPEFMEQPPILLPTYSKNKGASQANEEQSVYMEMTPRSSRKCILDDKNTESSTGLEEDNYITTAELNMPSSCSASTVPRNKGGLAARQRALLQATKNISHSDNQLLASNLETMLSDWYSDPFLAPTLPTPIPAPRSHDANIIPQVPPRSAKPTPSPCRSPKTNRRKI
ncbi:putative Phosphoinositide 3-kinase adapter protein 1 [Daphnia magna]|uniref:Putative Phosphoinositide 3-kinase adapter protein 1 n=1 Tax=Daphnia magna TaxID=35525 RepID=A0A164NHI8_9CRUS|nr:putative Phosphoinositide 3-kinase adapter protein 1 [Daphnia magna]